MSQESIRESMEPIEAFVLFKTAPENMTEVIERLYKLKESPPEGIIINKIVPVAGRLDCVMDITAASPADHFLFISTELKNIKGISSVESLIGNEDWANYASEMAHGHSQLPISVSSINPGQFQTTKSVKNLSSRAARLRYQMSQPH